MTNKADELAEKILASVKHGFNHQEWVNAIAAALRSYRDEALEEAAKVAETIYGTRFHDKCEVRTCRKIALNLRALKSQSSSEGDGK